MSNRVARINSPHGHWGRQLAPVKRTMGAVKSPVSFGGDVEPKTQTGRVANISGVSVLPATTVRIRAGDLADPKAVHVGTGYMYNIEFEGGMLPLVVSNRHVICSRAWISLELRLANQTGAPIRARPVPIRMEADNAVVIGHPDPAVDLAVVCAAPFADQLYASGRTVFWPRGQRAFDMDLETATHIAVSESVFMVGYPDGIFDDLNGLPLVRRGTLATPYDANFKGRSEFVIDIATFAGSSGSPVFAVREEFHQNAGRGAWHKSAEIILLGFLSAGFTTPLSGRATQRTNVPTQLNARPNFEQMLHLGICVKASRLTEIIAYMKEHPSEALGMGQAKNT